MKSVISALLLPLFLTGCSIIPKQVEFFQKKVQSFPEKSRKYGETERQAAQLAAEKAREAEKIAISDGSEAALPAGESAELTEALIRSLGPPKDAWQGTVLALIQRLDRENAKLRAEVESFKRKNDEIEGKKVEGTGVFQISYFLYVALVIGAIFVGYIVLKIVLALVSAANPAVGVGLNVAQLGGKALSRAFAQVVKGGEAFKRAVAGAEKPLTSEEIRDLFRQNQMVTQDPETQSLIRELTR